MKKDVFAWIDNIGVTLQVTMSYLQIYQEKIYDLLNSTNKVELSLREHPVKGLWTYTSKKIHFFVIQCSSGFPKLALTDLKKKLE